MLGELSFGGYLGGSGSSGGRWSLLPLYAITATATSRILAADGQTTASAANQIFVDLEMRVCFSGYVTAKREASSSYATWFIEGEAYRNVSGSSTTLAWSTITLKAGLATLGLSISTNSTIGCVTITVTGLASTNLVWRANIQAHFVYSL
jgi:hypothetical protein